MTMERGRTSVGGMSKIIGTVMDGTILHYLLNVNGVGCAALKQEFCSQVTV
jgi:hypothetical protein